MAAVSASPTTNGYQCNFGEVSASYVASRTGYPDEIYTHIKALVPPNTLIVDVCSGTGISSRELVDHGFSVIGVDKDPVMIREARKVHSHTINYIEFDLENGLDVLKGKELAADGIDVITTFTGFHWFSDSAKAIDGIFNTLKDNGYFIIVAGFGYKRGKGDKLQAQIEREIAAVLREPLPEKTVDVDHALKCFKKILDVQVPHEHSYTPKEYFELLKSRNYWGHARVSHDIEQKLLGIMEDMIQKYSALHDGVIKTTGQNRVLIVQKKVD